MDNIYNELFKSGNKAQLEKMIENEDEKGGWDCIDLDFAISEITHNIEALERYSKALEIDPDLLKDINILHKMIREKAANIANFAHMIIYDYDNIIKSHKERTK